MTLKRRQSAGIPIRRTGALTTQDLINPGAWFDPKWIDWRNSFIFPIVTGRSYSIRWFNIQWTVAALYCVSVLLCAAAAVRMHWSERWVRTAVVALLVGSAISLLLASEFAYPIYTLSPQLRSVQWPYRFLTIPSLCVPLALVFALAVARNKGARVGWSPFLMAALVGNIALLIALELQVATSGRASGVEQRVMSGRFGQPEHRPATAGPGWPAYLSAGGFQAECKGLDATCTEMTTGTHRRTWNIELDRDADIRLPVFAFPAWELRIDGVSHSQPPDAVTGLIAIHLGPGKHQVKILWSSLFEERMGILLSALSIVILAVLAYWQRREKRPAIDAT